MMFSRRRFICGATASTLVLPSFMGMLTAKASAASDTILVIIGLGGGNDGYGMIMPIATAAYGQYQTLRPTLLPSEAALTAAGTNFDPDHKTAAAYATQYAMHPSFGALKGADPANNLRALYGQGQVALISGVGLPPSAPARTDHHTGAYYNSTGQLTGDPVPGWGSKIGAVLGNQTMSLISVSGIGYVLGQAGTPVLAVGDISDYGYGSWRSGQGTVSQPGSPAYAINYLNQTPTSSSTSEFVRSLGNDAVSFIGTVRGYAAKYPASDYRTDCYNPASGAFEYSDLKDQLKQVARLILAESPGRVYEASAGGYDTHGAQVKNQTWLLAQLSEGIAEFYAYMNKHGKGSNVVTTTVSDFGRTPYENGNQGTDHGTSTVGLIVGDRVNGGFYGQYPAFLKTALDEDNHFPVAVDFRAQLSKIVELFGADPTEFFPEYSASSTVNPDVSIYAYSQFAVAKLINA